MIQLKRAEDKDAQSLFELSQSTFVETFAKDNTKENMDLYLAATFSFSKQLNEIRDPRRLIEIAWVDKQAVGFLHMLKGEVDPSVKTEKPIEILRLYVDSKWHGKNVGAKLMERCLALASEQEFKSVWLGVWEKNFRAQAFYKKYDFEFVGAHIFKLGQDAQTDLIMVRKLDY